MPKKKQLLGVFTYEKSEEDEPEAAEVIVKAVKMILSKGVSIDEKCNNILP